MPGITLSLAVHSHQPVGNLDQVYQGICTLLWWEVALEVERPWEVT